MSEREQPRVEVDRPRCPYCHESVGGEDEKTGCGACMAWHHRRCWSEHGACSACAAKEAAGAAATATAPAPEPWRPTPELAPFQASERKGAKVMIAIGVASVALFGAFIIWDLLGGPDLADLSSLFVLLGATLAGWGTHILGTTRRTAAPRRRRAK